MTPALHGHTVASLVDATAERLSEPALVSEDPRHEARELVAFAMGVLPKDLDARAGELVDDAHQAAFLRALERRLAPEPTGYIVGAVEIGGTRFKVDRRGFIARLDLTVLVDAAASRLPEDVRGYGCDLACGIGAAGILLAQRRPGLFIDFADVSAEAIELAQENVDLHVPGRGRGYAGDLFEPLPRDRRGRYVVVTANPPWVPDGTQLPDEVNHEPTVSFFGGPDGLDIVRRLVAQLPEWLAPGGVYAQECDPSQVAAVQALLERTGLRDARAHPDREGVSRVVSARKP